MALEEIVGSESVTRGANPRTDSTGSNARDLKHCINTCINKDPDSGSRSEYKGSKCFSFEQ
jgi:hypothetical protein